MIEYASIYLKKQGVEYARIILNVSDAVHNLRSLPTPLTWYALENLEALNFPSKFEVNRTYSCWVLATCLIKLKKWRVWWDKIRESIFQHCDHQTSIKIGTMLYFSNIYAAVRWNKMFGIFTWFQFPEIAFFTVSKLFPHQTWRYLHLSTPIKRVFYKKVMVITSSKLKQKKQRFTYWKIYFCKNDPLLTEIWRIKQKPYL